MTKEDSSEFLRKTEQMLDLFASSPPLACHWSLIRCLCER